MRELAALLCAGLVMSALVAGADAATSLRVTVKTKQGPTTVHPHPPAGSVGDTFVSSLDLVNAGKPQLGRRARARVGKMRFTYTIRKQCRSFTKTCVATADFKTVTTLPGGKVVADGKGISIAKANITIPVVGGTGRFKGVRGTVTISPVSRKVSVYRLKLR